MHRGSNCLVTQLHTSAGMDLELQILSFASE